MNLITPKEICTIIITWLCTYCTYMYIMDKKVMICSAGNIFYSSNSKASSLTIFLSYCDQCFLQTLILQEYLVVIRDGPQKKKIGLSLLLDCRLNIGIIRGIPHLEIMTMVANATNICVLGNQKFWFSCHNDNYNYLCCWAKRVHIMSLYIIILKEVNPSFHFDVLILSHRETSKWLTMFKITQNWNFAIDYVMYNYGLFSNS